MALITNIISISRANVIKDSLTGIANGEKTGIAYDLADGIVNGKVIG